MKQIIRIKILKAQFELERLKIFRDKDQTHQTAPVAQEILSNLDWLKEAVIGFSEKESSSKNTWENQNLLTQIDQLQINLLRFQLENARLEPEQEKNSDPLK